MTKINENTGQFYILNADHIPTIPQKCQVTNQNGLIPHYTVNSC